MVPNTNDGSILRPRLRCYLNLATLETLPEFSMGPRAADPGLQLKAIQQAGYDGVQFAGEPDTSVRVECRRMGLGIAASGRINEPGEAAPFAERLARDGFECATIHLGWGLEDEDAADALIRAVLTASDAYRFPIYVETHRATLFQDMWRTVGFTKRFPDLRFNGDFSHWYTGQEMVYGGFERKLAAIEPVLERVRFLHGRIGDPGSIQVDIGRATPDERPYIGHFRRMWTAVFAGFLRTAQAGDYICFAPELLAPRIYYARTFRDSAQGLREEGDRWRQALMLSGIARECFAAAQRQFGMAAGR